MNKVYAVKIPITGFIEIMVKADNNESAIDKVCDEFPFTENSTKFQFDKSFRSIGIIDASLVELRTYNKNEIITEICNDYEEEN